MKTDMELQKNRELNLELHPFIQDKLDEGASAPDLASMLVVIATRLGLDLDVDLRWVLLNSLNAIALSLEMDLDEEPEEVPENPDDSMPDGSLADSIVSLNAARTVH